MFLGLCVSARDSICLDVPIGYCGDVDRQFIP